jgi:hypothetical protein
MNINTDDLKAFDPSQPIVLGFAGGYCTGKTSTANIIAPPARMMPIDDEQTYSIVWDHLYFALPLYRFASIRQDIHGQHARDRMHYEIHAALLDVLGESPLYGAPGYNDFVQMVYEIAEYPCPTDTKPRSFLQYVGTDIMRAYDEDVWVNWMDRKIKNEHRNFLWEHREVDPCCEHSCANEELDRPQPLYGVVLSDCRFRNEAELVVNQPNGILIKFTVSPEEAERRQVDRDGYAMSDEQKSHSSEHQWDSIPEEWYTCTIDTTAISLEQQAKTVKDIVTQKTGALHA